MTDQTVVGLDADGKPVTVAELQRSFMRQSDYTQKTTEAAEIRKQAEAETAWARQNEWFLNDISSGDPARVQAALGRIAQAAGVQLGDPASQAQPGSRDPATGRFVASQQNATGALQKLDPTQFEDHPLVTVVNNLIDQMGAKDTALEAISKKIGDFESGVQTAMKNQQVEADLSAAAQVYKGHGLDTDVEAARKLIGQPMTAQQAMTLSHFEKILRHNAAVLRGGQGGQGAAPNEPAGVGGQNLDMSNMSLKQALEAATHSRV